MSLKEKFLKSIEELNRLLGIGQEVEETKKGVETQVAEEQVKEEVLSEAQENTNNAAEASPRCSSGEEAPTTDTKESGDETLCEEAVVKGVQLTTILEMVTKTAEKTAQIGKQFAEVARTMEEREKAIVTNLSKAITTLCGSVDELANIVVELQKRLERLEREPVKKSVSVINRFPEEETKKSVNLTDISNRLFELVVNGSIPPDELAKFDATKSVDVLSERTKKLLNL